MAFGLLATMRNEAPFILEWIAYHQIIGFEKFLIFSNNSDDGTTEILDALAKAGIIEHKYNDLSQESGVLWKEIAQQARDSNFFTNGDWMIWLDIDEFLNIKFGDKTLKSLENALDERDGALLSWRVFGDGGHSCFNGSLISNAYTQAEALPGDKSRSMAITAKAFFRYDDKICGFANHHPLYQSDAFANLRYVNSDFEELSPSVGIIRSWSRGRDKSRLGAEFGQIPKTLSHAQINHYMVVSRAFFLRKAARGRIGGPNASGRYGARTFRGFNLNEVEDRSILVFAEKVAQRRRELHALVSRDLDLKSLLSQHYGPEMINLSGYIEFGGDGSGPV